MPFDRVWDRLTDALAELPAGERPSWNPPVTDDDLAALGSAVAPRPLTPDLVALLRRADGVDLAGNPGWLQGIVAGDFQSAGQMVEWRRTMESWGGAGTSWSTAWLYLTRESHNQALIELADTRPGIILDATVGGLPRPLAPSLTSLFAAITDFIAEGHAADVIGTPWSPDTRTEFGERAAETRRWFRAYYQERTGWGEAPFQQVPGPPTEREGISPDAWPQEWRD